MSQEPILLARGLCKEYRLAGENSLTRKTLSAVQDVQREFGFPVLAIANVKEIFAAGRQLATAEGTPYVTDEIAGAAEEYLTQYGA